ncbi:uncharacterized protein RMCC_1349 [Mycolicibacterium canariasense]|uniref:Uncharacterized protein n=1 Tax=Mycolicibacterium canariasense TaxID=228230 RepID=A0A117I973_MYCCR|nr:hypothetical protein [Mycolicibacterium canariasense]MCV7208829.1 hypothetical protein [Mycolicibacterium canariasense]ORV07108.1 hypothetical protein AWB94_13985 [Mycolicibacterium canariasense]GAS94383.1 uncharacterized protein RMCC_1349 [Mycolicibacterium canariasense]
MAVHVHTGYTSPKEPHRHPLADDYTVTPEGVLILSTGRCGSVAVYAPGHWTRAEIVRNRGADGRFVKRS